MKTLLVCSDARRGWYPCDPLICALNLLGVAVALYVIVAICPPAAVAVFPGCVALACFASCIYHWLPHARWRYNIDQVMILALIAATFVPYWALKLAPFEMSVRLSVLGFAVVAGGTILVVLEGYRPLRAALFGGVALFGLVTAYQELPLWMPPEGVVKFWTGVALYAIQFAIWTFRWPNPLPDICRFSEVQHVFALPAMVLHMDAAMLLWQ